VSLVINDVNQFTATLLHENFAVFFWAKLHFELKMHFLRHLFFF